jgi:mannose-6-phosphate isomerase-like protein (cupin superfamily)
MHVAPADLRAVRQDGITIRFAMLGSMAYVLAELPKDGSPGTSLERPCEQPHWGFVIDGDLSIVTERQRLAIPAGRAFHVPAGGPQHHFETSGPALVAGFAPVESPVDVSDDSLVAKGFELLSEPTKTTVVPPIPPQRVGAGQIRIETWRMSDYLMTRTRMGERSGYTAGWCDAPHWGLVLSGRIAIEWEDDVEILSKGDIFHCPAGPPGHRVEAADPASFLDLTPISAFEGGGRMADWRRGSVNASRSRSRGIAVAALG